MPALVPTRHVAEVIWLGVTPDRAAALRSAPRDILRLGFDGPEGESHAGLTRPSDSRVTSQYPKGTEIRNVRQVSIVSEEDLDAIATRMGLPRLDPTWFGATIVLRGIPDFTHVPPSSRLQDEESGATLTIDMENRPCLLVAREIEAAHPGYGKALKPAAEGRRGVTAWVEREGSIAIGARLRLHVPDQPPWPHLAEARARGARP
ncbi:MOSC domain-containing protein [Roseibacterium sp. SDUM158016]|uniref:MOSC domain-containing protein n=1 Tax=Roseicyclus sediminis TaxID=2980997 RepID=UPI0021D24C19|nr:MOSC domain-containing protein [Roseibacterium sp. SDUM158016]MCU4654486.1 MOSC domain-containing protein [Roseibacterium sp. SDUM158016]